MSSLTSRIIELASFSFYNVAPSKPIFPLLPQPSGGAITEATLRCLRAAFRLRLVCPSSTTHTLPLLDVTFAAPPPFLHCHSSAAHHAPLVRKFLLVRSSSPQPPFQPSPQQKTLVAQDPRKTPVDAFHKFQQSSRSLNKTSAPLPCIEATQQKVSNVYDAFESEPCCETQKCQLMKC